MRFAGDRMNDLAAYASAPHMLDGGRLYAFALAGGLAGSISPCILSMLPVNLSYIGSSGAATRGAAIRLATLFVAGVALVNTVLGLTSSLFFAIFIQYRGQVNLAVGAFTIAAALWTAGILRIRIPPLVAAMPVNLGPVAVGIAFGLATSPCSSPILFAVLTAASRSGDPAVSIGAMTTYSVGYTAVLWLASVSTGLVAVSRRILPYGTLVTRLSAFVLGALGLSTVAYGAALLR
jgi:cytochrome c-type biogenesis protein